MYLQLGFTGCTRLHTVGGLVSEGQGASMQSQDMLKAALDVFR